MPAECALPNSPLAGVRKGIDACVHCGFCLQACPTYLALEDENDSPRGRILLMRSVLEGTLPPESDTVQEHIARCLGCRACETVCPSGVPYGHMLEATRETLAMHRPMSFIARVVLGVFSRPRLLSFVMALSRVFRATRLPRLLGRLGGRVGFSMAMLASTERAIRARPYAIPKRPGTRGGVAVLTGCVMEGLYAETNRATERVLEVNGYGVVPVEGQRCCGALHAHAGDGDGARALARANVAAFESANPDYIAVNAAGCGAMMKEYAQLLANDPEWSARASRVSAKVRDVSELLATAGPHRGGPVRARVTYDAPCHLLHAQRISAPPLDVLRAVPDLELVPLPESDQCCGAAGIYNLIEPETSNAVLARKLTNVLTTRADIVVTGNPGCLMQIGAGLHRAGSRARTAHPVDLLDAAYAARTNTPGDEPSAG
jgi:glycolate oxidase iron-sulfur subunit